MSCPSQALHSSQVYSAGEGGVVTAGKPNNQRRAGQRSLQVGHEVRALMSNDSFSEQAGLSMDWSILELLGGGLGVVGDGGIIAYGLCPRQVV